MNKLKLAAAATLLAAPIPLITFASTEEFPIFSSRNEHSLNNSRYLSDMAIISSLIPVMYSSLKLPLSMISIMDAIKNVYSDNL